MSLDHMGRSGFIRRFGLWSDDDALLATEVAQRVRDDGIHTVRLAFAD